MKAVTFHGPGDVRVEQVPEPSIQQPTDAIVRVTTTAICGSDLHPYHGRLPLPPGTTLGHELVGIIEETGSSVQKFRKGDRVVVAFNISDDTCWYCRNGWPSQCVNSQLLGFGQLGGTQAEYVRVPFIDGSAERIPDALTDEQAIFVGDIFSTGFFAADNGGVKPGDVVAVVGCGPVGLFAQMSAQLMGAAAVVAIDSVPDRLAKAQELGSIPVDYTKEDAGARVRALTDGRGADVVIDAVGHESAFQSTWGLVRGGGTISVVGVYVEQLPVHLGLMFMRDLTLKVGVCPVRRYMSRLIPLIQRGRVDLTKVITQSLPLDEAPKGYEQFNARANTVKVILKP